MTSVLDMTVKYMLFLWLLVHDHINFMKLMVLLVINNLKIILTFLTFCLAFNALDDMLNARFFVKFYS